MLGGRAELCLRNSRKSPGWGGQGLSLAGPFPSCFAGKQEVPALPQTHVLVLAGVREMQLLT